MAKSKTISGVDFDLTEFQRQKEVFRQHASQLISTKIEEIRASLREIKDLCDLSDVTVDIRSINADVEEIAQLHPDWNSSSYHC